MEQKNTFERQLDTTDNIQTAMKKNVNRSEKMLDRWEKITDRFDALVDCINAHYKCDTKTSKKDNIIIKAELANTADSVTLTVDGQKNILDRNKKSITWQKTKEEDSSQLDVSSNDGTKSCFISNPTYFDNIKHVTLRIKCIDKMLLTELHRQYNNPFTECLINQHPANTYTDDVHTIYCPNQAIKTTQGIEYLINAKNINFQNNYLEKTELENLTKLEKIDISSNPLIEQSFQTNIYLTSIRIWNTSIQTLNTENLKNLTELMTGGTKIEKIDVSKNMKLNYLDISSIDFSDDDPIKNHDRIKIGNYNTLETFNIGITGIKAFDFSPMINLKHLGIRAIPIESINIEENTKLLSIDAENCQLSEIDFSNNPHITNIYLPNNQLTYIELSNLKDLKYLNLSKNKLEFIDLSENLKLEYLTITDNAIKSIDLSKNKQITSYNDNKHTKIIL